MISLVSALSAWAVQPPAASAIGGALQLRPAHSVRVHAPLRCCDTLPPEAFESVPPEKLGDAWMRDEKAKELAEVLKGCSLYLVGFGQRKTAVGRLLSRRLPRYRFYDVSSLVCNTYSAMAKLEPMGMAQLLSSEPLADVEQLAQAVLREVQQFSRSVFVAWDGAIKKEDYMVMQQGIVVNLVFEELEDDEVALPSEDAEATREAWLEGHNKADVTVTLGRGLAADDAAYEVVTALLNFIEANPAKSKEWKQKADEALEKGGGQD